MLHKFIGFFVFMFSVVTLSSCTLIHRSADRVAKVQDISLDHTGEHYAEVVNQNNGRIYTGWSHMSRAQAKVTAFRLCHSNTSQLNVCRLIKST